MKPREKYALRMYYGGHSREEACLECKLSKWKFAQILKSEEGKKFCLKLEAELEHDLKALQGQYVKTLRDGMSSTDSKERLATAALYQRSPMFANLEDAGNTQHSAEDIVKQMMDAPQEAIENKGTKLLHFDPSKRTETDGKPV